jgi:hypothetical protein
MHSAKRLISSCFTKQEFAHTGGPMTIPSMTAIVTSAASVTGGATASFPAMGIFPPIFVFCKLGILLSSTPTVAAELELATISEIFLYFWAHSGHS